MWLLKVRKPEDYAGAEALFKSEERLMEYVREHGIKSYTMKWIEVYDE